MPRNRLLTTIAATALGVSLLGACSADSITEFGLERVLEAQSGEDVDLDFSNGGFDISTDEGDFSFNFDAENGSIVFGGDEGSGVIQFDDEGNVRFDTDEGSGTVQISDDGVVVNTDDQDEASFSIATNDDGSTVTTVGGELTAVTSPGVPTDWPAWLAVPASLDAENSSFTIANENGEASYLATLSHDAGEDYIGAFTAGLEAAGFSPVGTFTDTASAAGFRQWQNGDAFVTVTWDAASAFIIASAG